MHDPRAQQQRYTLVVHGPFDIPYSTPKKAPKWIDGEHAKAFWAMEETHRIATKIGCYVFALRAGRGFSPWYVGKTMKSFKDETFTADKLNKYNSVLVGGRKGNPVMFLVVPEKAGRGTMLKRVVDEAETDLIQAGIFKNRDLINLKKTKNLPAWHIKGVLRNGRGKPTAVEHQFKTMMRL